MQPPLVPFLLVALAVPAFAGAEPSMTREGPYGDPLLLRPAFLPDLGDARATRAAEDLALEARPEAGEPGRPRAPDARPAGQSRPSASLGGTREEELPPAIPGTFKPVPTRLPGVLLKTKTVTHHLTPDVDLALTPRASVGLFGEVGKVEFEHGPGLLPSVRARDLGAGVSLQYKLGQ